MSNTDKLLALLGLKGGTIHQVSKITGLTLNQILDLEKIPYTEYKSKSQNVGSVAFTNSGKYNREVLAEQYYSDFNFWKSAADSLKLLPFIK